MAKKTVKKETKKEVVIITALETQVLRLTAELKAQARDIYELNKRIDDIVNAHEKCKSLKNL